MSDAEIKPPDDSSEEIPLFRGDSGTSIDSIDGVEQKESIPLTAEHIALAWKLLHPETKQIVLNPARTVPTSIESGSSILENVYPLQALINDEAGERIVLSEVRDIVHEFRERMSDSMREGLWSAVVHARREMFGSRSQHTPGAYVTSDNDEFVYALMKNAPVLGVMESLIEKGANTATFVRTFVDIAARVRNKIMTQMAQEKLVMQKMALERRGITDAKSSNTTFLMNNKVADWLRIVGIVNPVPYDQLHQRGMYLFTNTKEPNHFAGFVESHVNGGNQRIIKGKEVLTIGPGNGSDEIKFLEGGAKSVDMIEGSQFMLERLRKRKLTLNSELAQNFNVPEAPQDMIRELARLAEADQKKYDTIYGHSVFHYFDDVTLSNLLASVNGCLKSGGHFAFAIKAPNAALDKDHAGILLINDVEQMHGSKGSSEERVHSRMRLNHDAQTRAFRDEKTWLHMLQTAGFQIENSTEFYIRDYETTDQGEQLFYYFIVKKLPVKQKA